MKRIAAAVIVAVLAALCPAADRFTFFNIAPFSPGSEEQLAKEMVEYRDRTGNDIVLYSLTLNPEGFPAMEKAEFLVASYRKLKAALAGTDVRLGVLMQATLGHWPRVDKDEEPWTRSVTLEGKPKRFCPLDPGCCQYIRDVVTLLAKERPCFLMLDDDVHASGAYGVECFCSRHVERFNRENGTAYTPDSLRAAVKDCRPGDATCRAFEKLQRAFVNETVDTIRAALDAVDPTIPGAACMPYREHRFAGETARRVAAKGQPVVLRIDNSIYMQRRLSGIPAALSHAMALCDYYRSVPCLLDESDTCPHDRFSMTAAALDMKLQGSIFCGLSGSKLWYCNAHKGPFPISRRYTDVLAAHRGLYDALVKAANGSELAGLVVPVTGGRLPWHPSMQSESFTDGRGWHVNMAGVFGVPFVCRSDLSREGTYLLGGGDVVRSLSDEEIRAVLRQRVLVDGTAAIELTKRGFENLIGVRAEARDFRYNGERELKTGTSYPFSKHAETPFLTALPGTATLTHLVYTPYGGSPDVEVVAPAATCVTNELGGRVVTTAYRACGWEWNDAWTEIRKAWFLKMLGVLGWNGWYALENQDLLMLERRTPQGETLLALLNTSFDPLETVRFHTPLRVASVETMGPHGTWESASWRQDGDVLTVDKPLACANALVLKIGNALQTAAPRLAVFQEHIVNMARTRQMSVGEAAREVRGWGIDGVELWAFEQEDTTDEILAAGFKPTSVIYFADFPHTNNQESADHVLAYAKRVGAPRIMLVPGFVRKDETREQAWAATKPRMAAFLKQAEKAGLEVDCEDFDMDTAVVGSGAHLRDTLAEFPMLGHVLDTGNYAYWKEDVLAFLDEFRPRIRHVHVKDRAADNPQRSVAAGTGTMPIREVVNRLQSSGYRGWYTLECFDGTNTWKGVAGSTDFFRKFGTGLTF